MLRSSLRLGVATIVAFGSVACLTGCKHDDTRHDGMMRSSSVPKNDMMMKAGKMENDGKMMVEKGKTMNDMEMQKNGKTLMEEGRIMKEKAMKM